MTEMRRVYHGLPTEDQQRATMFVPDYGHAGALELWGGPSTPPVISNHNTYWHWSRGKTEAEVLIAVGISERQLRTLYREVSQVGLVTCDYCMSWRSRMPVLLGRGPMASFEAVWPSVRHYE